MHDVIGLIAAILTTASFVPQAIMVVRTRDTAGISLVMYIMFTIGVAGWTSYGLMIGSVPVIAANVVTLVLATIILVMKLRAVIGARRMLMRA
ncbi:MAG: SemiSWEET transporter [Pseudomonadota bacterium]